MQSVSDKKQYKPVFETFKPDEGVYEKSVPKAFYNKAKEAVAIARKMSEPLPYYKQEWVRLGYLQKELKVSRWEAEYIWNKFTPFGFNVPKEK